MWCVIVDDAVLFCSLPNPTPFTVFGMSTTNCAKSASYRMTLQPGIDAHCGGLQTNMGRSRTDDCSAQLNTF